MKLTKILGTKISILAAQLAERMDQNANTLRNKLKQLKNELCVKLSDVFPNKLLRIQG